MPASEVSLKNSLSMSSSFTHEHRHWSLHVLDFCRGPFPGVAQVRRIAQDPELYLSSIPQHGGIDL